MKSLNLVASISLLMAAGVAASVGFVGCKARSYNAGVRAAGSGSGGKVFTSELPLEITPEKLSNWWKYGRNWEPLSAAQVAAIELSPEEEKNQFLQDNRKYPMTETPPNDYSADNVYEVLKKSVKPGDPRPANFNPLRYIRFNVAIKDRNKEQPTPRPLSAKTMLMALRKLREMNYLTTRASLNTMTAKAADYKTFSGCGYTMDPKTGLPCQEAFLVSAGDWEQDTLLWGLSRN